MESGEIKQPATAHTNHTGRIFWAIGGILAVVLIGVGLLLWTRQPGSPLPATVIMQADFPVYYPEKLPEGYTYEPGSASYDKNTVTYALKNGSDTVTVTQQANPKEKILYDKLPGFSPVGTNLGQAYLGDVDNRKVVIVQSSSILMTITADKSIAPETLTKIVQNLTSTT
jgi:hypothetical protein